MAQCYDNLTGGFTENCDRPIKSGLLRKGIIANVDDISEWITSGSANQFLPVFKAGKYGMPIEVIGAQPFNGTNVASAVDDFKRDFTKTVVFNIPESGSAAALRVEQLTKSQAGFVIMVEGKDAGGDLNGNFIIFGKDEPLLCTVAKDYVAGVSAPVITATSVERGYENFLFHTDLATTKTTFDTLYAGNLTKRIYFVAPAVDNAGDLSATVILAFGTAPETALYTLLFFGVSTNTAGSFAVAITPTVPNLAGTASVYSGVRASDPDAYAVTAVLFLTSDETQKYSGSIFSELGYILEG